MLDYINHSVYIINKLYRVSFFLEITKMKVLLVLATLVAITAANTCGSLQRLKVKRQWANAYGTGNSRADFGNFVWAELVMLE